MFCLKALTTISSNFCCDKTEPRKLHSPVIPANLENSAVAEGLEKISVHSNSKERQCHRMLKLLHNCTHFTCQQSHVQNFPSKASREDLNFQMYMNQELPDVQAGFRKGRGIRDQIANVKTCNES